MNPCVDTSSSTGPAEPALAASFGRRIGVAWCPSLALSLAQRRALILGVALVTGVFFRCFALDATGFAVDEINKLRAAESYHRLDFTANAEHPMLMKLAAFASFEAASRWNRVAARAGWRPVAPEAALRLPNALAGALTTVVIFLLAELFFGLRTAAWAALLWAWDVNATAVSRISKEDTFLVLFLFVAAWLYQRGKQEGSRVGRGGSRWYESSGAAFGLMLASKYMPHFYAIHAVFAQASDPKPGANRPRKVRFYLAMGAAFLAANFALLLPASWRYLSAYAHEHMVTHTGYYFAHHLYPNLIETSPWGTPVWFYFAFLGTKVPLLVLLAFAVGVVQMVRNPGHRGFIFARVFLVVFLLGYSLVSTKFLRYMLPLLVIIDILAAAGIVALLGWVEALKLPRWKAAIATGAIVLAFAGSPLYAEISWAPYYSLHQNAVGSRLGPPGWMFPDDEFYDAGMREAMEYVAGHAAPGAVVVSEVTSVVSEYAARFSRRDLASWALSLQGLPMTGVETWVLVQEGHIYYENAQMIDQLRRCLTPVLVVPVGGSVGVQVFRIPAARSGESPRAASGRVSP
jgi:hypothetical protein